MDYVAAYKVLYLTELVCFVGLAVPALIVFSAVAVALKEVDKSIAAIGGLFGVASEVIALALGSSPQSLHGGLVVLSNTYQSAEEADRASLANAADALIAATNAVSWAGILTDTSPTAPASTSMVPTTGPRKGALRMSEDRRGSRLLEALRPIIGPGLHALRAAPAGLVRAGRLEAAPPQPRAAPGEPGGTATALRSRRY